MVKDLNDRFGIGNMLNFELDQHGMERAIIKTPQAEAIIYLQGAHVTHYQPTGQKPVLFLSSKSNLVPGKAIRGGIPIIYPWFGAKKDDPSAPMHGFARTSQWQVEAAASAERSVEITFALSSPNHSRLRYTIRVGAQLHMDLEVHNLSANPFTFEEALHTYLAVGDVRMVCVQGLKGKTFIDKTDEMRRKKESDDTLRIRGETDRVYLDTSLTCKLFDLLWKRSISIRKFNSSTTVVWNPWMEKAMKMADLAPDEWQKMLCIESANAADNAIIVKPGKIHCMTASIGTGRLGPLPLFLKLQHPLSAVKRRAG